MAVLQLVIGCRIYEGWAMIYSAEVDSEHRHTARERVTLTFFHATWDSFRLINLIV